MATSSYGGVDAVAPLRPPMVCSSDCGKTQSDGSPALPATLPLAPLVAPLGPGSTSLVALCQWMLCSIVYCGGTSSKSCIDVGPATIRGSNVVLGEFCWMKPSGRTTESESAQSPAALLRWPGGGSKQNQVAPGEPLRKSIVYVPVTPVGAGNCWPRMS